MKTVILAGGYGSRIPEYTNKIPKPIFNIKKAVKVTGDWYLRVEKKMRIQLKSPANK
jgi:dTDP-glucose pyrophosphorylase